MKELPKAKDITEKYIDSLPKVTEDFTFKCNCGTMLAAGKDTIVRLWIDGKSFVPNGFILDHAARLRCPKCFKIQDVDIRFWYLNRNI